jgi:hypothetical protein
MENLGLIMLDIALPILVERVRRLGIAWRFRRSRSLLPDNWRECDWIVTVRKAGK